jgi:thiol-disulfide isomerase/thioredoxin
VADQRRKQSQTKKQQEQQRKKQQKQRNIVFAVVGAVVVLAAVLAVVLTQGGDDDTSTATDGNVEQVRPVTITGESLPRYDKAAQPDPAVGQTIPDVAGSNFAGAPVSITNDGKAKVVLFVAHWCPHCQKEVPLLAPDLRENGLPANVEMYTVSTGVNSSAPNYPPSEWLADNEWPTPVIVDNAENSAATAYGLSAYPYFVFADSQNRVVSRATGELTVEQFRAGIASISG